MSFMKKIWHKISGKSANRTERRKFIRLSAHHLLKYKVVNKEQEMSFVRNISAGGVLFYCKEQIPSESLIEMEISFPQYPRPIKVVAKVVRAKALKKMGGFEIGAEFVNAEEEARDFINKKIVSVFGEAKRITSGKEKTKREKK